MSRGKKYTRKQRKLNKAGKEIPMYCPNCHVQIPMTIFDREDKGFGYICSMCNTPVFGKLNELLDKIGVDELNRKEEVLF